MMTVIRVTNENGKKLHEETFTSEIRGTISITVDTQLATLRKAGEKMQAIAYNFKSVATFRETDGNCYHCGADETQTHSPKCHFDILQKELTAALAEWEAANK